MTATLRALEDKLRALEHELAGAEDPAPAPPARHEHPPPAEPAAGLAPPPTPAREALIARSRPPVMRPSEPEGGTERPSEDLSRIVAEATIRMRELRAQVEDLLRFRDQLRDSAQELIADYRSVLAANDAQRDGEETGAGSGSPSPPPAPVRVELDAGPFSELAALAAMEQALAQMPDVSEVHVRSLQDERARIELTLTGPIALVDRLRSVLPQPFRVTESAPDRMSIDIEAGLAG